MPKDSYFTVDPSTLKPVYVYVTRAHIKWTNAMCSSIESFMMLKHRMETNPIEIYTPEGVMMVVNTYCPELVGIPLYFPKDQEDAIEANAEVNIGDQEDAIEANAVVNIGDQEDAEI